MRWLALLALGGPLLASSGCVGVIDEPAPAPAPVEPPIVEVPSTAIPRLSRRELDAQLFTLFGVRGAAARNLPADPPTAVNPTTQADEEVFDTLAATKDPSQVFVEGLEALAVEVAEQLVANPAAVATIAGCSASGAGVDTACLAAFTDAVALQLWRRPITAEERDALLTTLVPIAQTAPDSPHLAAVRGVVMALLQSPELSYLSELGDARDGAKVQLSQRELVTRLAFFLWGDAPSPELLALPPLDDAALTALVDRMLGDPRAKAQQRTFHQLWLRWAGLLVPDAALADDMRAETDALLERALFTPSTPWTELFTAQQTWLTPRLARHYGLTEPAGGTPGWVEVVAPRSGLLSHGSFLSLSSTRIDDTLPSRRGAMLARRVLCQTVRPPPKDVNVDNGVEVKPGACKSEAYAAHRSRGGACAGCHAVIDGLGFGFERLDGQGRYREAEPQNAACAIDGAGSFAGKPFSGPAGLVFGQLETVSRCAVTQLARFGFRDREVPPQYLARFHQAFVDSGYDFATLMRTVALDPRFKVRFDQEAP